MLFNSIEFIVFFTVTVISYLLMPQRFRLHLLLVASLVFYGWTGPLFLIHLLVAAGLVYYFALAIEKAEDKPRKQTIMTIAIVLLVLNLVGFKYTSFFNETLRGLFGWFGAAYDVPVLNIILPLGISFYTFLMIGYLIDTFRGDKAERDPWVFGVFVFFFPKMIAGPIERGKNLLPQLRSPLKGFDYALMTAGLQLMLWGAFKKVVVADRIAPFVNRVYDNPQAYDGVSMVFATWLYAFQLYFDFSGYTDIALGAAMVFGIKLLPNFNRPYFAVSIQDFWKRWHISLSSWLNDYVYTPFSRSRWTGLKMYNLMLAGMMLTFVVSGFWHGANWTFIVWGALHGTYVVVSLLAQKPWNKFAKNSGLTKRPKTYRALKIGVTFFLVCFAYIFFRANSMADAGYILSHMHTGWGSATSGIRAVIDGKLAEMGLAILGIIVVMAPEWYKDHAKVGDIYRALPSWQRWGLVYAATVAVVVLGAYYNLDQKFIYFRF